MPELSTIARPYADAAFNRALETDQLDAWSAQLQTLSSVVGDDRLIEILSNPTIKSDQQLDIILGILEGSVSDEVKNFLKILADNGRLDTLVAIAAQFNDLKVTHLGMIDVEVISAYAVNQAQEKELAEALQARLGKEVNISSRKDPGLIGGVIIRAGDLVIDGSVKGKLERLATDLGI